MADTTLARAPRKVGGYLKEYAKGAKFQQKLGWSQEKLHKMWAKMNEAQKLAVMEALPKEAFTEAVAVAPQEEEVTVDPS